MATWQWVNLPKEDVFCEDGIQSEEYLGFLYFKCTFATSNPALFKVRVIPIIKADTPMYSRRELTCNPHFKMRYTRTYENYGKNEVKPDEELYLPAAGGNEYEIEANYDGQIIKGKHIRETRRKLYYQAIAMIGISPPPLGTTESYYEKMFVVLKNKGGLGQMTRIRNIDASDKNQRIKLIREAKDAYAIHRYKPCAFAVVFADSIANSAEKNFTIAKSPLLFAASKLFKIHSTHISYKLPNGHCFWYGINPNDDGENDGKGRWLVPGSCRWYDAKGDAHGIPDHDVSIDLTKRQKNGGYDTLKITITPELKGLLSSPAARISIRVRVLQGFVCGYSEPLANLVVVANRIGWSDDRSWDDDARVQTLIHEIGHKIGMVPAGVGPSLDPPATNTLYGNITSGPKANSYGHQGTHCKEGASYDGRQWGGRPGCVMFGASGLYTKLGTFARTPREYCAECAKLVRKLDLDGWAMPGFNISLTSY